MRSASKRLRRTSAATAAFLLTVVAGMVTTAATVHVTSATILPGNIGESASITPVASQTGGKIARVLVKDGDVVEEKQDLFVLNDDGLSAQRDALGDQLAAFTIKDARISAELAESTSFALPGELVERATQPAVARALQLEQQQLANDASSLQATMQSLQSQIATQQTSLAALKQQQADATNAAADSAYTGTPPSAYTTQIDATNAQITQISAQMEQARASAKTNLLTLAAENRTSMNDTQAKIQQADAQLADLHVEAPGSGTVSESVLSEAGQYLPPSATAMNIVGAGASLVVTARLPVADAPFVTKGDRVLIDLTTGDKLKTTSIRGTVTTISANPSSRGKTAPAYTVRITVSPKTAASVHSASALTNGMPAQVHVESGSQSILHYLVAPVVERMRFAFHER